MNYHSGFSYRKLVQGLIWGYYGIMETTYQSRHIQMLFGVSNETVRTWSEEFSQYLSPTANPGTGKHRHFTDDDLEIFALISEMKKQGQTYTDIHLALKNGQRGNVPTLSANEMITLAGNQHSLALAMRVEELQVEAQKLRIERDDALDKLRSKNDELISIKATHKATEDRVNQLSEQLEKAQEEVKKLLREIGTAYSRGVLDVLREKGDLPEKYNDLEKPSLNED